MYIVIRIDSVGGEWGNHKFYSWFFDSLTWSAVGAI